MARTASISSLVTVVSRPLSAMPTASTARDASGGTISTGSMASPVSVVGGGGGVDGGAGLAAAPGPFSSAAGLSGSAGAGSVSASAFGADVGAPGFSDSACASSGGFSDAAVSSWTSSTGIASARVDWCSDRKAAATTPTRPRCTTSDATSPTGARAMRPAFATPPPPEPAARTAAPPAAAADEEPIGDTGPPAGRVSSVRACFAPGSATRIRPETATARGRDGPSCRPR